MNIKIVLPLLFICLLITSCSLNGFISCPKDKSVNTVLTYENDSLKTKESLKINIKKVKKNIYYITYEVTLPIKPRGNKDYALCNLDILKEDSKNEITIHLTPYKRSIGKPGADNRDKVRIYKLYKKKKEKLSPKIKKIKFVYQKEEQVINLPENKTEIIFSIKK